jgi:hypothetical protein
MQLQASEKVIDCPGCGATITVRITPDRARSTGRTIFMNVDTGDVRTHIAERHPEAVTRYAEAEAAAADAIAAEVAQ